MRLKLLFALLSVSLVVSVFGKPVPVTEVFDEQVYSAVTSLSSRFQIFRSRLRV